MARVAPALMCFLVLLGCGRFGFGPEASSSAQDAGSSDASEDQDAARDGGTNVEDSGEPCVPVDEICNGVDDDCDETIDEETEDFLCSPGELCSEGTCVGAVGYGWDRSYGGAFYDTVNAMATDASGNIFAAGVFKGFVDFGSGVSASGEEGSFVLSLAPDGSLRWVRVVSGDGNAATSGIAVGEDGNLCVVGMVSGEIDFGGGVRLVSRGQHVFVLNLSSSGAHRWVRTFPIGNLFSRVGGCAMGPAGEVVVAASVEDEVDFGGGARSSVGAYDIAVFSLDAAGDYRWDMVRGSAGFDVGWDVAVSDDGSVTVVGERSGTIDFGGGVRTGPGAFVLQLDRDGGHVWDYNAPGSVSLQSVELGPEANLYVGGNFGGDVDFGGGLRGTGIFGDVVVLSLDPDGRYRWDRTVGSSRRSLELEDIAVDPTGRVAAGGSTRAAVDFGGGNRMVVGLDSGFAWALDSTGAYLWDHVLSGSTEDGVQAVAWSTAGSLVVGGHFSDSVDFGGGERTSAGLGDAFILRLDPAR